MDINTDKVDDAVLALLYLTLHDGARAWKSLDWDAMNRLHQKGLILDPVRKSKSVVLTEAGLNESAIAGMPGSRLHLNPSLQRRRWPCVTY